MTIARPRVFYVSYDGMGEPLGQSQVVAYLRRLSSEYAITLVSFEKSQPTSQLRRQLSDIGIEWRPLRYHHRPSVLSTALDAISGRMELVRAAKAGDPCVVHVRSYLPALIALLGRRRTGGKLLFDIRGFWADERVEGGLWRRDGVLYRIAKRCERTFFAEANAIVTLTEASVPQIRQWTSGRDVPIEVIPTCVDLERFGERPERPGGPHAVWSGSVGTWYRFDLAPQIADALSLPLTVITRQTDVASGMLAGYPASVASAAPDAVRDKLFAGDVGLCLIASSFSKIASAPTRFAEYLAAGMPVVVTPGVGDLQEIVRDRDVGVVLGGEDDRAIAAAANRMHELMKDEALTRRCRRAAEELFDVDAGSRRYADLYRRLAG